MTPCVRGRPQEPLIAGEEEQMASSERLDVLCVGEGLAVTYPAEDLASAEHPRLVVHTGGAEGNVALHLAAQGMRVGWASRVGADPFGRMVVADLARGGVDVSTVHVDDVHVTGMYLKDTRPDGRTFMHYYRSNSAASYMDVEDVGRFLVGRAAWVHVSGITVAISRSAARMIDALIDACRAEGANISFDVNFRPRLWSAAEAADGLLAIAQRADLVFVGRDEAEDLWATAQAEDVFALLDRPALVVVKDGEFGAYEIDRRGDLPATAFEPTPSVDVVEVIGAGDAFAGGYLAGLLRGEDASSRLRRGHASAAWTIGSWDDVRPGHQPAPFATDPSEDPL